MSDQSVAETAAHVPEVTPVDRAISANTHATLLVDLREDRRSINNTIVQVSGFFIIVSGALLGFLVAGSFDLMDKAVMMKLIPIVGFAALFVSIVVVQILRGGLYEVQQGGCAIQAKLDKLGADLAYKPFRETPRQRDGRLTAPGWVHLCGFVVWTFVALLNIPYFNQLIQRAVSSLY